MIFLNKLGTMPTLVIRMFGNSGGTSLRNVF